MSARRPRGSQGHTDTQGVAGQWPALRGDRVGGGRVLTKDGTRRDRPNTLREKTVKLEFRVTDTPFGNGESRTSSCLRSRDG